MSESPAMIPCGSLILEACYDSGSGVEAAVICHPHPLYGGSMDNNVVAAVQKTLRDLGWGTLRFNFRGVGGSTGHHKGAAGDAEDLLTVFHYLQQQGKKRLHLAGYSYGAWIGLKAIAHGLQPATSILVSPPLDFLDFKGLNPPFCPSLITLGDEDDFCAVESLKTWVSLHPGGESRLQIQILPRCDHFYWGRESLLSQEITEFLRGDIVPGSV
jgi:uncharacterized protein